MDPAGMFFISNIKKKFPLTTQCSADSVPSLPHTLLSLKKLPAKVWLNVCLHACVCISVHILCVCVCVRACFVHKACILPQPELRSPLLKLLWPDAHTYFTRRINTRGHKNRKAQCSTFALAHSDPVHIPDWTEASLTEFGILLMNRSVYDLAGT